MCFNFHHLKADYKDGNKWELMEPDYMELKVIFEKWQMGNAEGEMHGMHCFGAIMISLVSVSRFGNEGDIWKEFSKDACRYDSSNARNSLYLSGRRNRNDESALYIY